MLTNVSGSRIVKAMPAATILSLTAAASMSMALPAGAASSHHFKPTQAQIDKLAGQKTHLAKLAQAAAANRGIGEGGQGNFGIGKIVLPIEAMPGTYPASLDPVAFPGIVLNGVVHDVVINPVPTDEPEVCGLLDPNHCGLPFVPVGDTYTVSADATSVLPTGFLLPAPVDGSLDNLDPPACTPVGGSGGPPGLVVSTAICDGPTIEVPGAWRPIGVTVSNKVTSDLVAGATYALYGADESIPTSHARGSARGAADVLLDTATSDSNGQITFSGVHLGGSYSVVQTNGPKGFVTDSATHALTVPDVTTATAGQAFNGAVQLTPLAPTLYDDKSGGAFGKKQVIKVLANDIAASKPLTVDKATKPSHGTVTVNKDNTVTYAPAKGFSGTDTFTYAASNALGGTGQATVTVIVHPKIVVEGEGAQLPFTGSRTTAEFQVGLGAVVFGMLLTGLGLRRRRQPR